MWGRHKKDLLIVHHSLTKDGQTVSASAIRKYHVETNGWQDVGYHLLCELVGDHYEMLVGRPLSAKAAAAPQYNANERGIHVCFVGNFDEAAPEEAMLRFAAPHLAHICYLAGISVDASHVLGHRDVNPHKSCPGTQFSLNRLIALMQVE